MFTLTRNEFESINPDYRGVWQKECTDLPKWPQIREQYVGKRTILRQGALLIEDMHFSIMT